MQNITKLIALILQLAEGIKLYLLTLKKERLKDAAKEAIEEKDQRPLESELGTNSDSPRKHVGMYQRERKKKEGGLVDR